MKSISTDTGLPGVIFPSRCAVQLWGVGWPAGRRDIFYPLWQDRRYAGLPRSGAAGWKGSSRAQFAAHGHRPADRSPFSGLRRHSRGNYGDHSADLPYPEKRIYSSYAFETIEQALEAIRQLIQVGPVPRWYGFMTRQRRRFTSLIAKRRRGVPF